MGKKQAERGLPGKGMTGVILAGGLGTRLRPLTLKLPKALAEVDGKPFIDHLLSRLAALGVRDCMLLVGYRKEAIKRHCGSGGKYGLCLTYCEEGEGTMLGTGGALVNACQGAQGTLLVMNGDSFVEYDLARLAAFHKRRGALLTINAVAGPLEGRGKIVCGRGGKVPRFAEKQFGGRGLFNSGVYLVEGKAVGILSRAVQEGRLEKSFSLEREGFPILISHGGLYAMVSKGKFVDIGTFKSLAEAGRIMGE